jgi:TRAP-type C4-dicarboxylate transport system substrate-binding protein
MKTRRTALLSALMVPLAAFLGGEAAAESYVMKSTAVVSPGATIYVGMDYMAKRIPELTQNRVTVQVFKGTLGGERELFESLRAGTLQQVTGVTGSSG